MLERDQPITGPFPDHFIWACGSSAYQIEGGLVDTPRGLGIWDKASHTPGVISVRKAFLRNNV